MPTPPRHFRFNRRRTHFVDVVFWDPHKNPEQQVWLSFLRKYQRRLLRWAQQKHRRLRQDGSGEDCRATATPAFRQPHTCTDTTAPGTSVPRQTHAPKPTQVPLQWQSTLESIGDRPKYQFSDELQEGELRRSKRLEQRRRAASSADPPTPADTRRPTTERGSDTRKVRWKINTLLARNTTCYDLVHQPVALEQFLAPTGFEPRYVRLLVQFTHVWVNEQMNTAGLAVSILQIQQSDVAPPRTFAFLDVVPEHLRHPPAQCTQEVQTDPVSLHPFGGGVGSGGGTASASASVGCGGGQPAAADAHRPKADTSRNDHPVYGKYFKMVSKGVPKPAVQHKMRMNGVDPEVLDYPPDKPLPSCGEDDAGAGCGAGDQLTLSLQDTQQLRKTEINADRPKAVANGAGHGFSLNEIVSGLKSLRKTFFGSSSSSKDDEARKKETDQSEAALSANTSRDETSLVCHNQSSAFLKLLGAKYQNGC